MSRSTLIRILVVVPPVLSLLGGAAVAAIPDSAPGAVIRVDLRGLGFTDAEGVELDDADAVAVITAVRDDGTVEIAALGYDGRLRARAGRHPGTVADPIAVAGRRVYVLRGRSIDRYALPGLTRLTSLFLPATCARELGIDVQAGRAWCLAPAGETLVPVGADVATGMAISYPAIAGGQRLAPSQSSGALLTVGTATPTITVWSPTPNGLTALRRQTVEQASGGVTDAAVATGTAAAIVYDTTLFRNDLDLIALADPGSTLLSFTALRPVAVASSPSGAYTAVGGETVRIFSSASRTQIATYWPAGVGRTALPRGLRWGACGRVVLLTQAAGGPPLGTGIVFAR